MSKSVRIVTLAVALVFVLASVAVAAPPNDTVIVKFKEGTSAGQRSDALSDADVDATVGAVPEVGARVVRAEDSASATASALDGDPRVDYAEVNRRMHAAVVPNDPLFARQWALKLIGAPAAWDARALAGFPSGGGPVVGIVDSGVRTTHRDLVGAISGCLSASTTDAGSNVVDGGCEDLNGHGTNVTGTIVARAGNGIGTAGLAFNSTAIVCKALDANNVGLMSDISACIVALRDRGVRVINLSLVGPPSETLYRAIQYAYGEGTGALVVAASGNDGTTNVNYPAGYAEAMSVAATDSADAHPDFSTTNADVEISAPGVGIIGPYNNNDNGYAIFTGTSMAAPHVSGLAALLATVNPTLTAAGLRAAIDGSAVDLGAPGLDPVFGYGRIDVARAVAAAAASVEPPTEEPAPPEPPLEEPAADPSDPE
jgi:subtilisin family serine protease